MRWPFRKRVPKPLGSRGEDMAARHLKRKGYRILERNAWYGPNEIDIVAFEDDTVVFVEVRTTRHAGAVPPEDSVGHEKQRRLRRAAEFYIAAHPRWELYYRFDVIGIVLDASGQTRLEHIENAF